MSSSTAKVKFLLLKDFSKNMETGDQLADLRRQLCQFPDFQQVELMPDGQSTVVAWVPATNQRHRNRLKALMDENVAGWRVIDDQNYRLPATF